MHPTTAKVIADVTDLHRNEDHITSVASARSLGIKIRCAGGSSISNPHFSPAFFVPATAKKEKKWKLVPRRNGKKKKKKKKHTCVKKDVASDSVSVSGSRSSISSWSWASWSSSSPSSSLSSSSSPSSASPSASPACKACELESATAAIERMYPGMARCIAGKRKVAEPALPQVKSAPILTPGGAVTKGKYPQDATLTLFEKDEWKVSQVLEDTTHEHAHAIVEMRVQARTEEDLRSPTASEIKAVIRVLKIRMGIEQYQVDERYRVFPVLVLSYIVDSGNVISGRIMQAHHDGRQLMIQYSGRLELDVKESVPASLDRLVQYFFSDPANMD